MLSLGSVEWLYMSLLNEGQVMSMTDIPAAAPKASWEEEPGPGR